MDQPTIERRSAPVPRCTSYPTAPHFQWGVVAASYASWLALWSRAFACSFTCTCRSETGCAGSAAATPNRFGATSLSRPMCVRSSPKSASWPATSAAYSPSRRSISVVVLRACSSRPRLHGCMRRSIPDSRSHGTARSVWRSIRTTLRRNGWMHGLPSARPRGQIVQSRRSLWIAAPDRHDPDTHRRAGHRARPRRNFQRDAFGERIAR